MVPLLRWEDLKDAGKRSTASNSVETSSPVQGGECCELRPPDATGQLIWEDEGEETRTLSIERQLMRPAMALRSLPPRKGAVYMSIERS